MRQLPVNKEVHLHPDGLYGINTYGLDTFLAASLQHARSMNKAVVGFALIFPIQHNMVERSPYFRTKGGITVVFLEKHYWNV